MGLLKEQKNIVAKVPWSSSGRGIRYITDGDMTDSTMGFLSRTIQLQGGIMVEPYYPKVIDFGMEFVAKKDGSIVCLPSLEIDDRFKVTSQSKKVLTVSAQVC